MKIIFKMEDKQDVEAQHTLSLVNVFDILPPPPPPPQRLCKELHFVQCGEEKELWICVQ